MDLMILELWLSSMLEKVTSGDYESLQDLKKELEGAVFKLQEQRLRASPSEIT